MVRPDEGGGGPTLNPKAKQYERELFKVFSVETGPIYDTRTDWQNAKKQLEGLAKDVRSVHGELQAPADGSRGWSGPAAVAALASLQKLSETLDTHAGEIGAVDTSLGQVYTAVTDAWSGWYSEVASISTFVNPDDHKRPAPYLPTTDNAAKYSIRDPEAAAAAEDALWEQRNQAAKKVLDQLAADAQAAKGTMPIDVKDDSETPYENQGPASTNRTSGTASQSSSGGYISGGHAVVTGQPHPVGTHPVLPDDTGLIPVLPEDEPTMVIPDEGPGLTPGTYDPISSDGDVSGSTGLTPGAGPGGSQGGLPSGGGGVTAGGVAAGGVGGVAGLGGLLRGRAGGGMLPGGGAPRSGATSARSNGAGARGATARPGGMGRPGGAQMVPGGGGAAGRGGASARGSAVKGATGSGRYGVPKLGAGNGAVPAGGGQGGKGSGKSTGKVGARGTGGRGGAAMGAAAGGGARKGDNKDQPQDVDKLTHEDEETWFEGTEESSPQVWE